MGRGGRVDRASQMDQSSQVDQVGEEGPRTDTEFNLADVQEAIAGVIGDRDAIISSADG